MRILGIDPGMAIVGYALVNFEDNHLELEASGSIQTDKDMTTSERLLDIYNDLSTIIERYKPDCAAIEKLYFFKNQKTMQLHPEPAWFSFPIKYYIPVYLFSLQRSNQKFSFYNT